MVNILNDTSWAHVPEFLEDRFLDIELLGQRTGLIGEAVCNEVVRQISGMLSPWSQTGFKIPLAY